MDLFWLFLTSYNIFSGVNSRFYFSASLQIGWRTCYMHKFPLAAKSLKFSRGKLRTVV